MTNRHENDLKNDIESLVTKVKTIQISEALKKPDEMDADLVSECADFILEAENRVLLLSDDEIKKRVEKIPFITGEKLHAFKRQKIIKAAVIAAIILIILVITCVAIKPIRNFFTKVTDDGTFFSFNITNDNDYLYANYSYIPEGYLLVSENNSKTTQTTLYENQDKIIHISSFENENTGRFVNTENTIETKEIPIRQYTGYYCKNDDQTFLLWSTGKFNHVIIADNCNAITEDALIKIALSREKQ